MENSDTTPSDMENNTSQLQKFAKFVAAFQDRGDPAIGCLAEILKTEGDINYAIPFGKQLKSGKFYFQPGTVLHQMTQSTSVEVFELLLRHGADITKKNSEGRTALHALWRNCDFSGIDSSPIVKAYLSAHVEHSIPANPRDDNTGISHFHVACVAGHARAIVFFLENGVDVDQAIDQSSAYFPGCTPLHLAAVERPHLETVKKLLQRGADVQPKDARGLTPVCALIKRTLELVNATSSADPKCNQEIIRELLTSGNVNINNGTQISSYEYGCSTLHAACTVGDVSLAESLLEHIEDVDQAVSADSPFCPGYTALHFAAHFNLDLVKLLLKQKANLLARDANGVTPLDICAQRHSIEAVRYILSSQPALRDIAFADKRTKLLDLFRAMQSKTSYELFLDQIDDIDCRLDEASPLWPGYTPLHFAVLVFEQIKTQFWPVGRTMIGACMERGADCCVQDARGSSSLHMAARLRTSDVARELLSHCPDADPTDENDVSHLLVACAVDHRDDEDHPARKMPFSRADVNVATRSSVELFGRQFPAKSTPLHVLVAMDKPATTKFLIERGADLNATDEAGWSPVHKLMRKSSRKMTKVLFSFAAKMEERVVGGVGLSHLHVACRVGSSKSVKRLLSLGSDVNATIDCTATPDENCQLLRRHGYAGCTPLHIALRKGSIEIANILLDAGADILARNAEDISPLYQVMLYEEKLVVENGRLCKATDIRELLSVFVARLRSSEDLQARLRNTSGMTLLHFFAFAMDVEGVERLIDAGADVNAKLPADSPIWPGCTPLHAWVYGSRDPALKKDSATDVLKALLDAGADVTICNSESDTPLHLMLRLFGLSKGEDQSVLSHASTMMRSQQDFRANPANANGLSHFHLAVHLGEIAAVEEFLNNGVDVDQRVDVLSDVAAGCTSLHLLGHGQWAHSDESPARMETAELLLSHGADVHARDVRGNTPLHALANSPLRRLQLFERFVRAGAAIDATNIAGQTPFDAAFESGLDIPEIEFYLEQGYKLNAFNAVDQTGFLATALVVSAMRSQEVTEEIFRFFFDNADEMKLIDGAGGTALHNIVSTSRAEPIASKNFYDSYVQKLVHLGCDVNAQDHAGKTALHTAALFLNTPAVAALLSTGADVNVMDAEGKSAFDYAWDRCPRETVNCMIAIHVQGMLLARMHVCQRNRELAEEALGNRGYLNDSYKRNILSGFGKELEETRHIKIADADPLRLHDLLSETGVVAAYPTMPRSKRSAVVELFNRENEALKRVPNVTGLLRVQYYKMMKRAELIGSAHSSLQVLSDMDLPELVCEMLSRYLSFYDVQNLVISTKNK